VPDDTTRFRFPIDLLSDPLVDNGTKRLLAQASGGAASVLENWRRVRFHDTASELAGDAEPPPAKPEKPAEKTSPELSWVGFRVVDDETDQPVSGVALKVKLPNGEVRDFTTDGSGRIDVRDIQPGSCTIEKMIDDRALEVVRVA
jgi:hypothetical protein